MKVQDFYEYEKHLVDDKLIEEKLNQIYGSSRYSNELLAFISSMLERSPE